MIPLPDTIRVFPLGEVVLFPETLLPLHIFEPRYRKMLGDSLEDDRLIGMVLVSDADAEEPVPIYPVGCAGRIIEHKPMPDGRSLIVLEGTTKFRVRRELDTEEPYRVVQPQALYEAPIIAETMRAWRDALHERMRAYVRALGGEEDVLERTFEKLRPEGLVNYLSASLPLEILERQSLLECATVEQRYGRLCELLDFKIAEARLGLAADRDTDS
jgi:hypothetical protein